MGDFDVLLDRVPRAGAWLVFVWRSDFVARAGLRASGAAVSTEGDGAIHPGADVGHGQDPAEAANLTAPQHEAQSAQDLWRRCHAWRTCHT